MFNIFEQPEDVQQYILDEWDAAQLPMYEGEVYVNTLGKSYRVLEDSKINDIYVKVTHEHLGGVAVRQVPKIILVC